MSQGEAKAYAKKLGGDWRVPTIEELYAIVEPKCSSPAINSKVFPNVKDLGEGVAPYWSITKSKEIPSLFYYIDFLSGEVDGHIEGLQWQYALFAAANETMLFTQKPTRLDFGVQSRVTGNSIPCIEPQLASAAKNG